MNNPETEIRQLMQADDPAALEKIYCYAGRELYAYLVGLTGSGVEAEDLLSELFVKVAVRRRQVAKSAAIRAYLYRMATNLAYDRERQERRRERRQQEYAAFRVMGSPPPAPESEEMLRQLRRGLAELPVEQREAVVMKTYLDKTFAEIAVLTEVSVNTVISRYRYALKKLKNYLERRL
ncbi:MAG: RNA polymerase sigma factor [Victivallales bacterium]|nr:RNA polymerase sigma factor [Victivallales bacterium]